MGFVGRAWPDWPMELDGIDGIRKIPPDPSRAEWGTKLIKTDCDEKGLFLAAAVSDHRRLLFGDVVAAVLTLEDFTQHLLLLFQVVQLVRCLRAACLDEVGAEAQRIAGLAQVKNLSCVHDSLLPICFADCLFCRNYFLV